MQSNVPTKCMWSNKFHAPTLDQLRDGYDQLMLPTLDEVRHTLLDLPGVSESVVWHGVPWRWTMVYKCSLEAREPITRAFAYIIPDPARLQVCVPLTRAAVASLPMRRFKKNLRDAIIHAHTVSGLSWPSWDIPGSLAVEDVADLIRRKHRVLTVPTERIALSA